MSDSNKPNPSSSSKPIIANDSFAGLSGVPLSMAGASGLAPKPQNTNTQASPQSSSNGTSVTIPSKSNTK